MAALSRAELDPEPPQEDSFERERRCPPRYYSLPYLLVDYSSIDCSAPRQLLDEEPNNAREWRKRRDAPGTRFKLRIACCELVELAGLCELAARVARVSHVTLLDLNSNRLERLSELDRFPHLHTLLLHGNELADAEAIEPALQLAQLEVLTLHGNPVSLCVGLRAYVLRRLPRLRQLDFAAVTETEREQAALADLRRFGAKRENVILQKLQTPGQLREARARRAAEQAAAQAALAK